MYFGGKKGGGSRLAVLVAPVAFKCIIMSLLLLVNGGFVLNHFKSGRLRTIRTNHCPPFFKLILSLKHRFGLIFFFFCLCCCGFKIIFISSFFSVWSGKERYVFMYLIRMSWSTLFYSPISDLHHLYSHGVSSLLLLIRRRGDNTPGV